MNKFTKLIAAVALSAFAGIASAVPISGTLAFNGYLTTDTNDVLTAEVFDFLFPVTVLADGSFSALNFQDITYNTLDLTAPLPIAPLWTATGSDSVAYHFDLLSITQNSDDGSTRTIAGIGNIYVGTDFATYSWSLSTQNPGVGNPDDPLTFSFSASQKAVPEPAITLLLATGLVGFGFARRARKTA